MSQNTTHQTYLLRIKLISKTNRVYGLQHLHACEQDFFVRVLALLNQKVSWNAGDSLSLYRLRIV